MSDQLHRDQESNALLAGDIRRSIRITVIVVSVFAVMLMLGNHGNLEAGVTLIWVVAVPLGLLALLARLCARWCGDASIHDPARTRLDPVEPIPPDARTVRDVPHGLAASPGQGPAPTIVGGELGVAERRRCRVEHARRPLVARRPVGWRQDPTRRDRPAP